VVTDPAGLAARERVTVDCAAPDDALLLADWLNAIVYEMAVRRLLFARYAVTFTPSGLHGEAWGEPVTSAHEPAVEVKGATYTALAVTQSPSGEWVAQCVVDV
jgi:tRNA nucleotidyltransferase (CCA-adding enzyme)